MSDVSQARDTQSKQGGTPQGLTILVVLVPAFLLRVSLLLAAFVHSPVLGSVPAPLKLRFGASLVSAAVICPCAPSFPAVTPLLRSGPVFRLLVPVICAFVSLSLPLTYILYQLGEAAFGRASAAAAVSPSLHMTILLGMRGANLM